MLEYSQNPPDKNKLMVVWTSGDREVAFKMVFMYVYNAKKNGWWEDITLLIWGPSSKLASEDTEIQDSLKQMMEIGVQVIACLACADLCHNTKGLEELGVTVKYTGTDLTSYIKEQHVITF